MKNKYKAQKEWRDRNPNYGKENYLKNKIKYAEYGKEYRKKNRERLNNKSRKWALEHPEKVIKNLRSSHLRRNYNISLERYDEMLANQKNCCAICGINNSELKNPLGVDHNHNTNRVRELLCSNCNSAIGLINEDVGRFVKIIEYINKHSMIGKTLPFDASKWVAYYQNLYETFN